MSLINREEEKNVNSENTDIVYEKPKMSLYAKFKIILIVSIILFTGSSIGKGIYDGSKEIAIDNPTGSGIVIQFNDLPEVNIQAYTFTKIPLETGAYSLKVNGIEMGEFEKKFFNGKSFLNPTNEIYISEFSLYGDESGFSKLPNNKISVYGNEAEGPFKQYEGIYIEGNWHYNINESFPSEIKIKGGYKIKEKIYRFNDFVEMYNKYYAISEESEK